MKHIFNFQFLIFTLLSALCSPLFAQGSIYSQFGVGELQTSSNARNVSMSGINITTFSKNSINLFSPSTIGEINRTVFSAGFAYEGVQMKDATNSSFLSKGIFSGASLAFPVYSPKNIVFGIGLLPFSRVDYEVKNSASQLGINYTTKHLGSGGLSQFVSAISYKPLSQLQLGISYNYIFGTIKNTENFLSYSFQTVSTNTTLSQHYGGNSFRIGLLYSANQEILGLQNLNIGAQISPSISLKTENDSLIEYFSTDNIYETPSSQFSSSSDSYTTTFPMIMNFGISGQLNERFLLGTEIELQQWKNFKVNVIHPTNLENSFRFSLGGEYVSSKEFTSPYTSRIAYRFGFHYAKTPYYINSTTINETGISAGFGFPIAGDSRLNIAFQMSMRGTTDANLLKENSFGLHISFDGNELMFIRPEKE